MDIFDACEDGLLDTVKKIGKIHDKSEDGCTTLYIAAANGHHDVFNYLLQEGVDMNEINDSGCTVLMAALAHGQIKMAHELLKAGCDPNIKDFKGRTALHYACMANSIQGVELLRFFNVAIVKDYSKMYPHQLSNNDEIKKIFTVTGK